MGLVPAPLAPGPLLALRPLVTHPQVPKARAAVRRLQVLEACYADAELRSHCQYHMTLRSSDKVLQGGAYLQL